MNPCLILDSLTMSVVRLWDVRQLHNVPKSSSNLEVLEEPEDEKDQTIVETWPEINTGNEVVRDYGASPNGQALARGVYKHKLSCSSAFWDPYIGFHCLNGRTFQAHSLVFFLLAGRVARFSPRATTTTSDAGISPMVAPSNLMRLSPPSSLGTRGQ